MALKPEFAQHSRVDILVDAGAAASVLPTNALQGYVAESGPAKRAGVKYVTADGGVIPNVGEVSLPFIARGGIKCRTLFQVADVSKPLLAVTKLTKAGFEVTFGEHGGKITPKDGRGKPLEFAKKGGVYILSVLVPPFRRQGEQ